MIPTPINLDPLFIALHTMSMCTVGVARVCTTVPRTESYFDQHYRFWSSSQTSGQGLHSMVKLGV